MQTLKTINPATALPLRAYDTITNAEIDDKINTAHTAFLKWRQTNFDQRSDYLYKVQATLLANKQKYAELITAEMGKPIRDAISEIEKCALVCEFYADNAEKLLQNRIIKTSYQTSYVCYRPSGIIFAVMPWNFPFWQVFRFAAPNLMAGHACLLKHAEVVTGCGLAIADCFNQAGLPTDLFQTLLIHSAQAEHVIKNPKVRGVTLTGSEGAGKSVAAEAGKNLKKVVLELGGSDPYVILHDANLEQAAEACVISRLNNSGQVCIAAKRLIIDERIYADFKKIILEKIKDYKIGDPTLEATNMGPLAREDLRDQVHTQVEKALHQGAKLIKGGEIPKQTGFYYPVTVLENVAPGNVAFDEEIFGPVIVLIKANDEAHALNLANHSRFGLGAAVFTKNREHGEAIAREHLDAGSVAVNTFVASNPALPFGGTKFSGFGRELSAEGLHEFMNTKTVVVK